MNCLSLWGNETPCISCLSTALPALQKFMNEFEVSIWIASFGMCDATYNPSFKVIFGAVSDINPRGSLVEPLQANEMDVIKTAGMPRKAKKHMRS